MLYNLYNRYYILTTLINMAHPRLGPPESAHEEEKESVIAGKYLSGTVDGWSVL